MYGEKLKKLRKKMGMSQAELGKKIGFPQTTISSAEKSTYPSIEFIANALSVLAPEMTLSEFFGDELKNGYPPLISISEETLELAVQIEKLSPVKKNKFIKFILSALDLIRN